MSNTQTYKIGDRFTSNDGEYLLAQVDSCICCLIHLSAGNRSANGITVISPFAITQYELEQMAIGINNLVII